MVEYPTIVAAASIELGPITVCDRLIAADFEFNDRRKYEWREQSTVIVFGDDWVDTVDATCSEDTIRVTKDDPNGNYPVIELLMTDGDVSAQDVVKGDPVPLVVTNVETWSGVVELAVVGPDLEAARDVGLAVVSSIINEDVATFRSLLHDDMIFFDGSAATTPVEVMGYAEEDGFPWGNDHSDHTLVDYLFDRVLAVTYLADTNLSDETKALLSQISNGGGVVIFEGVGHRPFEPRFRLGADLGRFALMETAQGWKVIAL